jgi:hypothetical protein
VLYGEHPLLLKVANELLYRHDEARIEVVELGRPWSFDGDGGLFRLISEAHRIHLAHLDAMSNPFAWSSGPTKARELASREKSLGAPDHDLDTKIGKNSNASWSETRRTARRASEGNSE